MSENTEDFDDFLVPERDELRARGGKQKRGNSIPILEETVQLSGTSGTVKFLLGFLVLGLLGAGGAGYSFYTQGQGMLAELDSAETRLRLLEARLSMTDEAAQQSSLSLLEKVDLNFSEIDKLWAARNQNRSNTTANKNALDDHSETLTAMETVISGQSSNLNETANLLASVETRIEALSNNLAGMDNLGQQLSSINADLTQVKASMASQGTGLAGRVEGNEQDIESINIFRLQINQTLNSIQSSINNLQQQVGPQI